MTCVEMTQAQAPLAQLAEHLTLNQGVQGSNPWRRIHIWIIYIQNSRLDREFFYVLTIIVRTYFFTLKYLLMML